VTCCCKCRHPLATVLTYGSSCWAALQHCHSVALQQQMQLEQQQTQVEQQQGLALAAHLTAALARGVAADSQG
jgi:hypothetical protein